MIYDPIKYIMLVNKTKSNPGPLSYARQDINFLYTTVHFIPHIPYNKTFDLESF